MWFLTKKGRKQKKKQSEQGCTSAAALRSGGFQLASADAGSLGSQQSFLCH